MFLLKKIGLLFIFRILIGWLKLLCPILSFHHIPVLILVKGEKDSVPDHLAPSLTFSTAA